MIEKIVDICEKIGFAASLCASGYLAYVGQYDAAILFSLWGIILLIMDVWFGGGDEGYV